MIRLAVAEDIPEIVDMLVLFQSEAGCYAHIDPCKDSLAEFCGKMIDSPHTDIAVYYSGVIQGMCGIVSVPSWFNREQWTAQEMFWYIKPEYRGKIGPATRLFKFLERWAVEHGAKSLSVASTATLNTGKLEHFYSKKGFVKADIYYIKEVQNAS